MVLPFVGQVVGDIANDVKCFLLHEFASGAVRIFGNPAAVGALARFRVRKAENQLVPA
jgi:hypothetical protein